MKNLVLLLLLISASLFAREKKIDEQLLKQKELETLKQYVQAAQDSLQHDIASRWRNKQRQVEQRENDKIELEEYREKLERLHIELARLKEESFAKNSIIEDKNKLLLIKQEEWKFISTTLEETFEKDAELILESFPVEMEGKKQDLEKIRREFKRSGNAGISFNQYLNFKTKYFDRGVSIQLNKHTVIPNSGTPQELNYIRFGNLFAYGMNPTGEAYLIHQTGSLGVNKYSVDKLGISQLNDFILITLPQWIEKQKVEGPVVIDVLQNAQSAILISGKKIDTKQKLIIWFNAGGPIMIPLFAMLGWAIILTIWKIIQFISKSGGNKKLSKVVLDCLSKNDIEGAKKFSSNRKGVVARIVNTCLDHAKWNRSSAEKAVKEILIEELPAINRHLNTLAVLAGAAPLMGLLGTVTGMINLFEVITNYGTGDPKLLAGGISEALITTEVGLIIAIPILLVHNFLRNRTNNLQAEMEKHAIRILNRLWPEI